MGDAKLMVSQVEKSHFQAVALPLAVATIASKVLISLIPLSVHLTPGSVLPDTQDNLADRPDPMDDPDYDDVILWLVPHKGKGFDGASNSIAMDKNKSRLVAAHHEVPKQRHSHRQDGRGTELPVERGLSQDTACLAVRFSHGAKTSFGVVGGCAANADLSFEGLPGVGKYHIAIAFDDQNRPIVRDLGSRGGTKVTYYGEERRRLSNFDWPLEGPSIANGRPPILNITNDMQFQVILPPRDYTAPPYIDKVKNFRLGTGDPENLLTSLDIQSALGTQLPSTQQSPLKNSRSREVLYKKEIGKGNFGEVIFVWDIKTREEYVVKQPRKEHIKNLEVMKMWGREADIMRSVSHEHIVAFRDVTFIPNPKLKLEYVPGGTLDSHEHLSMFECTQVLFQLSSALEYLHNRNPSITHRDIKPENILVQSRGADGIYVKFADFGLSKAAAVLKTRCGSAFWGAPEIYLKTADLAGAEDNTYSEAVDIWSLGFVVASRKCGFPEFEEGWDHVAWTREVTRHISRYHLEHGGELLHLIIDSMLVEDPDERSSADHINTEALKILRNMANESINEGTATPTASVFGTESVSVVELESLDENSESTDVSDLDEERELANAPDPENRLSQISETTEVPPQRSTVDGLRLISGEPVQASCGSEATELGTIEAQIEDPHEGTENASFITRCTPGDEGVREAVEFPSEAQSMRKRMSHRANDAKSQSEQAEQGLAAGSQGDSVRDVGLYMRKKRKTGAFKHSAVED